MNRPRKPASESSTSSERNAVRPLRQQELETVRGGDGVVVRVPESP